MSKPSGKRSRMRAGFYKEQPITDLKNKKIIWLKGWLFLFAGLFASGLLLYEAWHWKAVLLLAIAVWCFCRFYYFAFYVIEHYVDPGYKFAGLWDFVKYALGWKR
ncbi:MAG: hypothetical protein AAF711_13310 [Planctomycetota bacterium]